MKSSEILQDKLSPRAQLLSPMIYMSILDLCLEERGIDTRKMLEKVGVDQRLLNQAEAKVASEKMAHFAVMAENAIPDPDFWFSYGEKLTIATHGTLGHALMACQNLGQVLGFFTRYYHIQIPTLNIQRMDDEHFVILSFARDDVLAKVMRFGVEVIYSALYTNLKILLNQISFPVTFCFDSPEPNLKTLASYHKHLGADLQFACEIPQIKVAKSYLKHPIVFSNPLMQRYYAEQCELQLKKLLEPQDTVTTVMRLLKVTPGYFPSMAQVASQMNISERTLRRKLEQQTTSYREILDEVKKEQVLDLLKNAQVSIEHIASLMDYSDQANFRRAFKKWTGYSPAEYRKQQRNNL